MASNVSSGEKPEDDLDLTEKVRHMSAKFENLSQSLSTAVTNSLSREGNSKSIVTKGKSGKSASTAVNRTDHVWLCKKCSTAFSDNRAMVLECEMCATHMCSKCLKLSPAKYEAIARDDVIWFCNPKCRSALLDLKQKNVLMDKIEQTLAKFEIVMEKVDKIESAVEKIDKVEVAVGRIDKLEVTMTKLEESLARATKAANGKSETEGILADILQQLGQSTATEGENAAASTDQPDGTLSKDGPWNEVRKSRVSLRQIMRAEEATAPQVKVIIKEAMEEKEKEKEIESQEKDERAPNIIIFRAKESEEKDREKRSAADEKLVNGFIKEVIGEDEVEVESFTRLGRKEEGKSRPLRIRLKSLDDKRRLLDNLVNLRDAPEPYRTMSVRHDLTPHQRDDYKKMVDEAKEKTADLDPDTYVFKVRSTPGPHWDAKIVRLKARQPQAN